MKSKSKMLLLFILVTSFMPLFFVNCGKKVEPVYRDTASSTASAGGLSPINSFTTNPPVMEGQVGFTFLMSQYFGKHCGSCHSNPDSPLMKPLFNLSDMQHSYDLSRVTLDKTDMVMRLTANPFCPDCALDKNGEVYKAIMYWLDHR